MSIDQAATPKPEGPGSSRVTVPGIVVLVIYFMLLSAFLLYGLAILWPVPSSAGGGAELTLGAHAPQVPEQQYGIVDFFGTQWKVSDEVRLLALVMVAGALGSLIHALRSLYWYVGNRNLVRSWIPKYILLPYCGATLAVLFYMITRAGFFSPDSGSAHASPFGFCAFAALVGLFCEMAILKLKEIAETIFKPPERGKDAIPPTSPDKPGTSDKPTALDKPIIAAAGDNPRQDT